MKLAIVEFGGTPRVAALQGEELLDLTDSVFVRPEELPKFLSWGAEARSLVSRRLKASRTRIPIEAVKFRAPLTRPDKLLGIGMNYRSFVHAAREIGMPIPPEKIWFLRPSSCIVGPYDPVWLPADALDLDYEVELALVIGQRCSRLSAQEAPAVIAGFAVANDMTLRDRVRKSIVLAKSFETHTPIGPWIVTPDELGDPQNLAVKTWVNGELRQDSTTADMITGCYELIAELSTAFTLNPGDIILTGTPAGSGIFQKPAQWLRAGDLVKLQIEKIGEIENRIFCEPAQSSSPDFPG